MSATRSAVCPTLAAVCSVILVACHPSPPARMDVPVEAQWVTLACDTTPVEPSQKLGGLGDADRDSLVREVRVRRAAWRARGVTDYRVRVAMRCFCPASPPAILEVRRGIPVALLDSTGRPAGPPRQPYAYTIEGLFDLIERAAQQGELRQVSYAPCLGYPTSVRVDPEGLDNWYWIILDRLTTPR